MVGAEYIGWDGTGETLSAYPFADAYRISCAVEWGSVRVSKDFCQENQAKASESAASATAMSAMAE